MKRNLWYFILEPIKSRYTTQLCKEWMPATFAKYKDTLNVIEIEGDTVSQEIKVGSVLDAIGRGIYSNSQCSKFLLEIQNGNVKDNDIIFLQDYWTSGIESIFYALDLYGIKNIKIYAMLHAQSVDEYDFTFPMRDWMRLYELGLDKRMSGIFVGSTIHKLQLREAGFNAPIHVLSLPIHKQYTLDTLRFHYTPDELKEHKFNKKKVIVFSSRLDKEKNPYFMLAVAKEFLNRYKDYEWHVTTSGIGFRSTIPGFITELYNYAETEPRFKLLTGLTKEEYYIELATCTAQFNSSLQDYVSWTVIESTIFDADIVFPDFRSFPEFIPKNRLYTPFNIDSALDVLCEAIINPTTHPHIGELSDLGRQMEGYIMANDITEELNVWHEAEYCKHLLND